MGPCDGACEPQRDGRLDGRPAHHRHRVERQQHPVHHDQREPGGAPIPPGSRKDHRPPRPAAQADRQIHGREHPAHGAFLVVQRPLPHHLLRAIGTAQIALLLPLCPDIGHNGLYPAGVHRIPVFETRRAEPGVDRAGEGDGTPTGHPHLVVARVDRIPALAGRGSERRGGDEQRPHAPDEDRRPLLEDRLRNTPYPGQHQRSSGRVGHVFP